MPIRKGSRLDIHEHQDNVWIYLILGKVRREPQVVVEVLMGVSVGHDRAGDGLHIRYIGGVEMR